MERHNGHTRPARGTDLDALPVANSGYIHRPRTGELGEPRNVSVTLLLEALTT